MPEIAAGIDLCEICRMDGMTENARFLSRILTPDEIAYLETKGSTKSQTLAGFWAAKEAVLKALGTGLAIPMREVEIIHIPSGAPRCVLHGQAFEAAGHGSVAVSITHEAGIAAAVAVMIREEDGTHEPER